MMKVWNTLGYGLDTEQLDKIDTKKYEEFIKTNYPDEWDNMLTNEDSFTHVLDNIYNYELFTSDYGEISEYNPIVAVLNCESDIPIILATQTDSPDNTIIVYQPSYPWNLSENERNLIPEDIQKAFEAVLSPLLRDGEKLHFDYHSVEQWG